VKISSFILLVISVSVAMVFCLLLNISLKLTFAQVPQDTFSAGGLIVSPVSNTLQPISHTAGKSTTAATPPVNSATPPQSTTSSSYRLNGTWLLTVNNGQVTNFKAIAAMLPINRTATNSNANNHTYEISNFHNQKNRYTQLYPNGVAFIVGTSDVKVDGNTKWKGVNTAVIIDSLVRFKVALDSNATNNLFNGQPIQGMTQSLKNSLGMPILSGTALPTSTEGQPQQQQQQPLSADNGPPIQTGPLLLPPQQTGPASQQNIPGQLNEFGQGGLLNQGPSTHGMITTQPSQNQGSNLSPSTSSAPASPPVPSLSTPPNPSPQNQAHPID